MKINLPVNQQEVSLKQGRPIVSKTDTKGIITFVNHEFVRISGFSEEELIGQNHNVVRHPDMPPQAFEDLWMTIKKGNHWSGVVKNRTKNTEWFDLTAELALRKSEEQKAEEIARIEKLSRESDLALLYENTRIRAGLDYVSMAVMIADNDNNIVYTNKALIDAMRLVENELRESNPDFSAEKLVGTPTSQFIKAAPQKKQDMPHDTAKVLDSMAGTFRAQLKVGSRRFQMVVNPVIGKNSERLGSVMEWLDRTDEIAAEKEVSRLVQGASAGELSQRANIDLLPPGFLRDTGIGINRILDAVVEPLNVAASYIDDIANGHMPPKITEEFKGDFDAIKNNLNTCIDAINALIGDANTLSKAAIEGRLSIRADASRHQGDFRKIIQGVNDTLDAVIEPLNVAAHYVNDISNGNIPEKISADYQGDFSNIKNNLNACIDAIHALVSDSMMLSKAAAESLEEQAAHMAEIVTQFNLNDHQVAILSDMTPDLIIHSQKLIASDAFKHGKSLASSRLLPMANHQ